jgi:hypothetical protein
MTQLNTSTSPLNRKGIVRMADGRLGTIAEMTGAEIAAEMTPAQRAKVLAGLGMNTGPRAALRSSGKGLTRLQIVAHAVENDPKCKGKAHLALAVLADDDLAGVNGSGIVKLLQRMPSSAGNDTDAIIAEMRAHFDGYSQDDPNGDKSSANHGWDAVHSEMRGKRSATASVWDKAISDIAQQ